MIWMPLSNEEIENLEKFLLSDDPSLQMMGISMSKNLDLPPRMYSLVSSLSVFSSEEKIRKEALNFVKEKFNFINAEFKNEELINASNLESLVISFILVAELNQISKLKWQGVHGSNAKDGWYLSNSQSKSRKIISLEKSKEMLRETPGWDNDVDLLVEIIFSIMVQLGEKKTRSLKDRSEFNELISNAIRSNLSRVDKKTYDNFAKSNIIISEIRTIFPSIADHYWYTEAKYKKILSKGRRKILSNLFLVGLAGRSREPEAMEYLINCVEKPENKPIWALTSVVLRESSFDAVPYVEKLYSENKKLERWSMDFLKDYGSGFYRMKNTKLNTELEKRSLRQSGHRKDKIMRLLEFVDSSGEQSIFLESKGRLENELSSDDADKVIELVKDMAYYPKLRNLLIDLFEDERLPVRHTALKSLNKLKWSSSTSEKYVVESLKLRLGDKNKMMRRGAVKALTGEPRDYYGWKWTHSREIFDDEDSGVKIILLDDMVKSWIDRSLIPRSPHIFFEGRHSVGFRIEDRTNDDSGTTDNYNFLVKQFKVMIDSDDEKTRKAGQISLMILENASTLAYGGNAVREAALSKAGHTIPARDTTMKKLNDLVKDGLGNLTKDLF
ncbi:MAG: hypothetical protein CL698_00540 [Chloroflexi bacterium]|nr:hypothetical protein [Chloroflexota bacterium]